LSQKIFIGNFSKGLTQNRLPFVIDNDAFPTLFNAYAWRGRAKRKRGTSLIGRLTVQLGETDAFTWATAGGTYATWSAWTVPWDESQIQGVFVGSVTLISSPQTFNIFTALGFTGNQAIVPGNLANITIVVGSQYMNDGVGNGALNIQTMGNISAATLNYSTGDLKLTFATGAGPLSVYFNGSYYPNLPVMGLEDFSSISAGQFPTLLAFDTDYSYQFLDTDISSNFYNTTYYKSSDVAFTFSGLDFQQFGSVNYEGALWVTNGNPGMHFGLVHACSNQASSTTITMTIYKGGSPVTNLVNGDYLFFNEGVATTFTLNGNSGIITTDSSASSGIYTVTFLTAQTVNTYTADSAMVQFLTNNATTTDGDGIRWYDGDPTGGTGFPTSDGLGWVNFMPPLSSGTEAFDNVTPAIYYLAGATAIYNFQDRLCFFGPYIQSKTGSTPIWLQDVVLWSWNGTPYYSNPTPAAETGIFYQPDPTAYQTDVSGKGGYKSAGLSQPIYTVIPNKDVLLLGFLNRQVSFVYTNNELGPFTFYSINSDLGSSATYSGITMDEGGLSIGNYGLVATDQTSTTRFDLQIPDQVFQIMKTPAALVAGNAVDTGPLRVNSARDFYKEWVYFSYPVSNSPWIYPTQTLLFNYRDETWSVLLENYTSHGTFRRNSALSWKTVGNTYPSWSTWTDSWDSSVTTAKFPSICAGNQQGFVMQLADGTGEAQSQYISKIAATSDPQKFTITSPNHCLLNNDFIYLQGITGVNTLNGLVGKVSIDPSSPNTFSLVFLNKPSFSTYLGGGTYARFSRPLIQTKQFPVYWEEGRQTRLGTSQYCFDTTVSGQVTVNINLSMNPDDSYNYGTIVPSLNSTNNSLIYSDVVFTSPEPGNLQMPTAASQYQIWHRMNTSLIGDTVQIGITLSDAQMYDLVLATSEIALQAIVLSVSRGPYNA